MGEAKRRRRTQQELGTDLTKELAEKGKLIEAGFAVIASVAMFEGAPATQLNEMRLVFMAGAEHVWSSMMTMLDPEEEPTEADLRRMNLIAKELDEWRGTLFERVNQPSETRRHSDFEALQPKDRLGDAPVEAQYVEKMTAIMQALDEFLNDGAKAPNKKVGLVVMMFPYGDTTGRCNYMSNGADRRDIITLMKEMIARFEGQPELSGKA